jgi:hypothetical protein
MHQIQILAGLIGTQVGAERVQGQVSVECLKSGQCEDGVIKIRPPFTVPSRTFRAELGLEKLGNQRGGIAEQPWGKAGNLEHVKAERHGIRCA